MGLNSPTFNCLNFSSSYLEVFIFLHTYKRAGNKEQYSRAGVLISGWVPNQFLFV